MDRQATLGFILIGLVLMVWMWYNAPPPPRPVQRADTTRTTIASPPEGPAVAPKQTVEHPSTSAPDAEEYGEFFSDRLIGSERIVIIETDLYTAELTTKGGLIRKWELKKYKTWNQYPVHLVEMNTGGDFSLLFISKDGKQINTRDLFFESDYPTWKKVVLKDRDSVTVTFTLPVREGKSILKRYTFTNGTYSFDADIEMQNVGDVISGFEYQIVWEHALPFAEHNSIDESHYAMAYAYSGGELAEVDAMHETEKAQKDISGVTDWVAARNKYFAVALLPAKDMTQGAFLEGVRSPQPDRGVKETYSIALKMPFKGTTSEAARVTVFLGPLDFNLIRSMDRGLDHIMSLGAAWIIRPITEYIMMPLFNFLHLFIANWGIVIIVFSIIIKIALHPLTKSSMNAMRKMQKLQPMMNEIREKYKDNPEQMNKAIMNLYREYGVNPAGGCLPLLLQMPILYALYNVFSSTIQLRQAHFVGWINDLSIPDTIVHLPFTIPLFGMSQLSGLALAMSITMFIQQKQTITDPRQKAMVWMMPVMMFLIFNGLPSGLNLYYFVFNLLSIGQQMWIKKKHGDEPLRKVDPKKAQGGLIGRLAKNMPDMKRR